MRSGTVSRAVRNSTGAAMPRARSAWQTSRPSESGNPMSSTSTSGGESPNARTASAPDAVARTLNPSRSSAWRRTPRSSSSSSQTPAVGPSGIRVMVRRAPRPRALAAGVDDDEVRDDAGHEAGGEQEQAELAVADAAHRVPHLADHVEDRAAGQRVEQQLEWLGSHLVADHRAQEHGTAADQPRQHE